MNINFKEGFEKSAFIEHFPLLMGIPFIEQKMAKRQFEEAKRKAMGLKYSDEVGAKSKWVMDKIERDYEWATSKPKATMVGKVNIPGSKKLDGFRKGLNKWLMDKSPALILHTPSEEGKQLGKFFNDLTDEIPFIDKQKIKETMSDASGPYQNKSGPARENLKKQIKKVKRGALLSGIALMGLGSLMGYGLAKKKGEKKSPPPPQTT